MSIKLRVNDISLDKAIDHKDWDWVPCDFGDNTGGRTVDEKFRKCLKLKKITSTNLGAVNTVKAQQLCGEGDIEFHVQELLMYYKGGHFEEHEDRVRRKAGLSHVGTLIVTTASGANGGDLEIDGEVVVKASSAASSHSKCVIALYL